MSKLEEILAAEEEAVQIVEHARSSAEERIMNAQSAYAEEVLVFRSELKKERSEKLVDQKPRLAEIYREILKEREGDVQKLREQAKHREENAIRHILESL